MEQIGETKSRLEALAASYDDLGGAELLAPLIQREFAGGIALVSSFGGESAVLLHMVSEIDPATPVLFLDTGFLFPETLDYQRELTRTLGLTDVRILTAEPLHEREFDPGRDLHQMHPNVCCFVRKVMPLRKGLAPFTAWISGRKRFHGGDRAALPVFERDGRHIKVNPLASWGAEEIDAYMKCHSLPAHPLVVEGYPSIGCVPCTTPVAPGEDRRAGRWRGTGQTECGIHFVNGGPVRDAAA